MISPAKLNVSFSSGVMKRVLVVQADLRKTRERDSVEEDPEGVEGGEAGEELNHPAMNQGKRGNVEIAAKKVKKISSTLD